MTAKVGDRVRLWLGPSKRGGFHYGEVIGIDNLGRPGTGRSRWTCTLGFATCYATPAGGPRPRRVCDHRLDGDGLLCARTDPHETGHVYVTGSYVPDRHDATSGGEH